MELLIVRHGLPDRWDPNGTAADPGLSETGRLQAERVAEVLLEENITRVYSSPMRRARETAAPLARLTGSTIDVESDLTEWDHDSADYIPMEELRRTDPARWEALRWGHFPDHVDAAAFHRRVGGVFQRIVAANPGRVSVAVFCHAGVINSYLAEVLGIDGPMPFPVAYVSISRVVATRDGHRTVVSVNERAHVKRMRSRR